MSDTVERICEFFETTCNNYGFNLKTNDTDRESIAEILAEHDAEQVTISQLTKELAHKNETANTFMEQVRKLQKELAEARERLKALLKAVDEFLSFTDENEVVGRSVLEKAWRVADGIWFSDSVTKAEQREDDWPATLFSSLEPAFHTDSKCAACDGPLEVDRDAICHKCTDQWVAERVKQGEKP